MTEISAEYDKQTIYNFIKKINKNEILLPAIQRKFVWNDKQIEDLMDSIMQGFPIGTFLIWNVKKNLINSENYSMYEFIRDFDERDNINKEVGPLHPEYEDDCVWTVLDGQQRLTSLYIALQGSTTRRKKGSHRDKSESYVKKQLYMHLLETTEETEGSGTCPFEFRFIEEADSETDNGCWFLVKDLLCYDNTTIYRFIKEKGIVDNIAASEVVIKLLNRLMYDQIINFSLIEGGLMNDVLDIFIRVNSGGTKLAKSDLLFSTVVSHWKEARTETDRLLKEASNSRNIVLNIDDIMRMSLYVVGLPTDLKVESFKQENVEKIKVNWDEIETAILESLRFLQDSGLCEDNIRSKVAITPIVYYFYKQNCNVNESSKKELLKYFVIAHLNQVFSSSTDSVLSSIRKCIEDNCKSTFDFNWFNELILPNNSSFKFTREDLENFIDSEEKNKNTYMVLSLLYSDLDLKSKCFHQDHMHPATRFNDVSDDFQLIDGRPIGSEKRNDWLHLRNTLPNLQILEGRENSSKNKNSLVDWLKIKKHKDWTICLPEGISYELANFDEFWMRRKELLMKELEDILL